LPLKLYNYAIMKSRVERIDLIRRIISGNKVSNQDELQLRLKEEGCEVTQATLSRDLTLIKVIKVNDPGNGYFYRLSENGRSESKQGEETLRGNFPAGEVLGIEFSGNLGVLKTLPGYAGGVAMMIDSMKAKELAGTIAGDDTILLVLREGITPGEVIEALKAVFVNLTNEN
jgi:transcriptional regulator of arginine metabolism